MEISFLKIETVIFFKIRDRTASAKVFFFLAFFLFASVGLLSARGPKVFDDKPVVSIYRDFDDGLLGRSLYRGVIFSVKLEALVRYRSYPVRDMDGLTAYLLSSPRAGELSQGMGKGIRRVPLERLDRDRSLPQARGPLDWLYVYDRAGINIEFSLESVPDEWYAEILQTYPNNPEVAKTVSDSYRKGYLLRIHKAINIFRPEIARVDYEDILLSAALIGDTFQPIWGLHDGNDLSAY